MSNHLEKAISFLESEKKEELVELLEELHPIEIVAVLNAVDSTAQLQLLKHITSLDQISEVIVNSGDHLRELALGLLDESRISAVIRRQDVDDAASVLENLPRRKRVKILKRLPSDLARDLSTLLKHEIETAGRIMTTRFLTFSPNISAENALNQLQKKLSQKKINQDSIEEETDLHYGYILGAQDSLLGVFSLRELLAAEPSTLLSLSLIHI